MRYLRLFAACVQSLRTELEKTHRFGAIVSLKLWSNYGRPWRALNRH